MNPINKKQFDSQESTKTKILTKLANLTAKISLKYDINFQEYFNLYKRALVRQAKKQKPDSTNVEIACRTGVDRRYINKYLESTDSSIKTPKIKLILNELKRICVNNNTKYIKKQGYFQTFESVCNQLASGSLTYSSVAQELIRQGKIEDLGNKYKLLQWRFVPKKNDKDQQFKILTTEINRLSDTIIYNFNQIDKINKQFQRNIYTTQIPPESFLVVKKQISEILKKSLTDIDTVIMEYETVVPSGTYPTFGASLFMFGYENHNDTEVS